MMAFNHPALLHGVLALSSLQVATLQSYPPTAALKHYHIAIRRVAKAVQDPKRRNHHATLAATLVLAYFEIWSSDHEKWSRHLYGSRQLMRAVPFRDLAKANLAYRRKVDADQRMVAPPQHPDAVIGDIGQVFEAGTRSFSHPDEAPRLHELDFEFLGAVSGLNVDYTIRGPDGLAQDVPTINGRPYRESDANEYEQLSDLFWLFVKMDLYQSILGGTKLL